MTSPMAGNDDNMKIVLAGFTDKFWALPALAIEVLLILTEANKVTFCF